MTRARERLLLFASPKDMTRGLWFAPQGDYRVWQGQSMLDWVMCALMDEPALRAEYARQLTEEENRALPLSTVSTGFPQPATPWKIRVYAACSPQPVQKNKVIHSLFTQLETWLCEGAGDKLGKRWAHIYDPGETLPLKTSVSSLVRGERERLSLLDAPEEETPAEKRQGSAVVPLLMEELPALPAFLRGEESHRRPPGHPAAQGLFPHGSGGSARPAAGGLAGRPPGAEGGVGLPAALHPPGGGAPAPGGPAALLHRSPGQAPAGQSPGQAGVELQLPPLP